MAFFHPERWPLLPRPQSAEELGRCLLEVLRTESGRLVLNSLVLTYLLGGEHGDISAERQLGRADVVRHLLEMLGAGLTHVPRHITADTNPWREE